MRLFTLPQYLIHAQSMRDDLVAVIERAGTERTVRHRVNRLPAVAVLGGFGFIALLVCHIPSTGVINFIVGMAISQTQFYTQPKVALRWLESRGADVKVKCAEGSGHESTGFD